MHIAVSLYTQIDSTQVPQNSKQMAIPRLSSFCGTHSSLRHWREMGNDKAKDCRMQWMMAATPPLRQPQRSRRNRKRWIASEGEGDPGVQIAVGYRFVCYIQHENITTWHQTAWWSTELPEKLTVAHLINFCPLCGLVVRVSGYRSRGTGSIPGPTRFSEK
jgi:hypothetical protein